MYSSRTDTISVSSRDSTYSDCETCSLASTRMSPNQTADDLPGAGRIIDTHFYQPAGRWLERKIANFRLAKGGSMCPKRPAHQETKYGLQCVKDKFSSYSYVEESWNDTTLADDNSPHMKHPEIHEDRGFSTDMSRVAEEDFRSTSCRVKQLTEDCRSNFDKSRTVSAQRSQVMLLNDISDTMQLCNRSEFVIVSITMILRQIATKRLYTYHPLTEHKIIVGPVLHFWKTTAETLSSLFQWWLKEGFTSSAAETIVIHHGAQIVSLSKELLMGIWHSWAYGRSSRKGCFLLPGWKSDTANFLLAIHSTLKITSILHIVGAMNSRVDLDVFCPSCRCEDIKQLISSASHLGKTGIDQIWRECLQGGRETLMNITSHADTALLEKRFSYLKLEMKQCLTQNISLRKANRSLRERIKMLCSASKIA